MSIESAVAVRDSSNIVIGTVSTAVVADNAFVDGIKNSTGLDSAIYSTDVLSATTLTSPDGKTRQIGIKQTSQTVKNQVLTKGQTFKGSLDLFNRPFLAVYAPLKDINNNVVGMLFIGQPQSSVLQSAGRSIELTFTLAVILMALAIVPAYLMARYIARQLQ
jgi:methyl-accepting chemotaxis protein